MVRRRPVSCAHGVLRGCAPRALRRVGCNDWGLSSLTLFTVYLSAGTDGLGTRVVIDHPPQRGCLAALVWWCGTFRLRPRRGRFDASNCYIIYIEFSRGKVHRLIRKYHFRRRARRGAAWRLGGCVCAVVRVPSNCGRAWCVCTLALVAEENRRRVLQRAAACAGRALRFVTEKSS